MFPNVYQHQVQQFELIDKTKKGTRKILVFFLVDPTTRIVSTEHVPPQQSSWMVRTLSTMPPFKDLPKEVFSLITSYVGSMGETMAKEYRNQLMSERKYFVEQNTQKEFERPFSLCEH